MLGPDPDYSWRPDPSPIFLWRLDPDPGQLHPDPQPISRHTSSWIHHQILYKRQIMKTMQFLILNNLRLWIKKYIYCVLKNI